MKYTMFGFNQEKLVEYDLDLVDAAILRYFIDFKETEDMLIEIVDNKPYYWLNYTKLKETIPVIKIKNNDVIRRRLKKLEDCGVLEHYFKKEGGSYSFYRPGKRYVELIRGTTEKSEGNTKGYDSKVGPGTTQKSDQKINLLNNKSNIYSRVVEYLNQKAGTSFKSSSKKTQQLIKARLDDGFKEEDFKKVIDIKTKEWLGTDFEKFLRPETLFSNKFEGYLNQKISSNKKTQEQPKANSGAYKEFKFD